MKRVLSVVVLALLVALVAAPGGAFAQGTTYTTTFQIQNQSSVTANVQVDFINKDGSTAVSFTGPIGGNSSVTFTPLLATVTGMRLPSGWASNPASGVPVGFDGSVVISADQPVAAISNVVTSNFQFGESYNGFAAGDTTVILPIIQRGNSGFNTWFNVQNTGQSETRVSIAYTPSVQNGTAVGNAANEGPITIKKGASATFNQANNTNLGARFIGLATVTSLDGAPIAVTVNQENVAGKLLLTYNGVGTSSASTTASLPLIQGNNSGFFTGIGITNVGNNPTDVTITYSANSVTAGAVAGQAACGTPPPFKILGLAKNAGVNVLQVTGSDPTIDPFFNSGCRYVGSATVSANEKIVAVVNQLGAGFSSSYEGFDPNTAGKSTVQVPLVMSGNSGYFSSIQVLNVGATGTTANVSINYSPNVANAADGGNALCGTPQQVKFDVAGQSSFTKFQLATTASDPAGDPQFNGCRYVGSATISGPTGSKLLVIVNQLGSNPGNLFTYSGFGQ